MNDNELQNLKPIYIQEALSSSEDEISLVDLSLILIRRKKTIISIIALFISIGILTALTNTKIYNYSSSIEIGSQLIDGNARLIESPQAIIAKVNFSFIPKLLDHYRSTNPSDKKVYEVKIENPSGSTLIVIKMNQPEDKANLINKFITQITQKIITEHDERFNGIKQSLELQLKQAKNKLIIMDSSTENIAEKIILQDKIDIYSSQLANLRHTKQASAPLRSQNPSGTSRIFIVIISAFAGIFFAIFAAFIAEFTSKVRERKTELGI